MKFSRMLLCLWLSLTSSNAQGTIDVSQHDISGSGLASALGSPFGQSFVPTSLAALLGVDLAVVDTNGVADVQVSLYHADASGSSLLGSPIATGTISAAQIIS